MIIIDDDGVMHKVIPVSVLQDIKADIQFWADWADEQLSKASSMAERASCIAKKGAYKNIIKIIDTHMESEDKE